MVSELADEGTMPPQLPAPASHAELRVYLHRRVTKSKQLSDYKFDFFADVGDKVFDTCDKVFSNLSAMLKSNQSSMSAVLLKSSSWSRFVRNSRRVLVNSLFVVFNSRSRSTESTSTTLVHPSSIAVPGAYPIEWKQFRGVVAEIDPLPPSQPNFAVKKHLQSRRIQTHFSLILCLLFIERSTLVTSKSMDSWSRVAVAVSSLQRLVTKPPKFGGSFKKIECSRKDEYSNLKKVDNASGVEDCIRTLEAIADVEASIRDYGERKQACYEVAKLWMQMPAPKRDEIVKQNGYALRAKVYHHGYLVSLEIGKILPEGIEEVLEIIDMCDFAVGLSHMMLEKNNLRGAIFHHWSSHSHG
nr:Aldehyde dehydrogenase family 7 member B4 [Ipomoea batatas]